MRTIIRMIGAATLGLVAVAHHGRAQRPADTAGVGVRSYPLDPEAAPRPSARAVRTPKAIVVDARLDEPEWQLAEPLGEFVQQLPRTGYAAAFRTEVRVLYDSDYVYLSAVNYDPEPGRAVTAGIEHDFNSGNSDVFGVVFDTFLDRSNSFLFLVNPHGAVRDEQTFDNSRTVVQAWEGIVDVRTAIRDSSWVVEMRIPLRTLRFDARKPIQSWGVNFIRRVQRTREHSYWAPLDRQHVLHRMSKAGTLTGFEGLRQGRNLQLKPSVVGGTSSGAQVPSAALGAKYDAGLDLKYGVTPSVTLDLTYNTDFSQVEVDQEQVNLTRFSRFFPERREFFIENSGSFTFGDVQERGYRMGASLSDFTLFNSRQIGLARDGRPIPILGGGRLSGRVSGFDVGLLNMQTERSLGGPAENFTVARLRRRAFGNSDVGLLVSNRQTTDSSGAYRRSYGVDANLRPFGNMVVNSYVALSDASTPGSNGYAARTSVAYRGPFWDNSVMWKRVSDAFDPGIGFVRRHAMQQYYATTGVHTRPNSSWIQEVNPFVDATYITDLSSRLDTRTLSAAVDLLFRPEGKLSLDFNDQFDRVNEPFVVFPGDTIPVGAYSYREASIQYQTGQVKPLSGNIGLSGGEFYTGRRRTYSGGLTWRARYDLSLEATLQRDDIVLPSGSFLADMAGARVRYAWSTKLFGTAFVQYNTQSKSFVTNARVNLRWAPLSDVFLVFTERQNIDTRVRNERSVVLKVTRMMAF